MVDTSFTAEEIFRSFGFDSIQVYKTYLKESERFFFFLHSFSCRHLRVFLVVLRTIISYILGKLDGFSFLSILFY